MFLGPADEGCRPRTGPVGHAHIVAGLDRIGGKFRATNKPLRPVYPL